MTRIKRVWIKNDCSRGVRVDGNGVRVGMFVTRRIYDVGSIVAISEPYCDICDRLGDWYVDLLCKEFQVSRDELPSLSGWTNRGHTRIDLLPRRLRIVEAKVLRAQDISDEEWGLLGANKSECSRIRVIGYDAWIRNTYLKLYKYELVDEIV